MSVTNIQLEDCEIGDYGSCETRGIYTYLNFEEDIAEIEMGANTGSRLEIVPILVGHLVKYIKTDGLMQWLQIQETNPLTNLTFPVEELKYLWERINAWQVYGQWEPSLERMGKIVDKLKKGSLTRQDQYIIRVYSGPTTFADHFKRLGEEIDDEEMGRLEMQAATRFLESDAVLEGTWILRHSSLNRLFIGQPGSVCGDDQRELRKRMGITFYALSFKRDGKIFHKLFVHRLGIGWAFTFGQSSFTPGMITWTEMDVGGWSPWFFDMLDNMINYYGLRFGGNQAGYFD